MKTRIWWNDFIKTSLYKTMKEILWFRGYSLVVNVENEIATDVYITKGGKRVWWRDFEQTRTFKIIHGMVRMGGYEFVINKDSDGTTQEVYLER